MKPRFELGPIRPPSEATSLLVRVTRNCPWNRCAFCPVYKDARFTVRDLEDVKNDIDAMAEVASMIREVSTSLGFDGEVNWEVRKQLAGRNDLVPGTAQITSFLADGGKNVFLQDANSVVMPTEDLVEMLEYLREKFPTIERITSYARAHTLTRKKPGHLVMLRKAGLNRVHVGLESGSDRVLDLISKGVDAASHIEGGLRAKQAGMELSEYVMPGLGGRALWREHAEETARVLNAIDPHFIRLRTTAVAPNTVLEELASLGKWEPMDDEQVADELRLFIERLEVTSAFRSDHILNLFSELEGQMPEDKPWLLSIIDRFRAMEPSLRRAFILARRGGMVSCLDEMDNEAAKESALHLLDSVETHYEGDLPAAVRDLMSRFV
jgi:Radical SAM superfamily